MVQICKLDGSKLGAVAATTDADTMIVAGYDLLLVGHVGEVPSALVVDCLARKVEYGIPGTCGTTTVAEVWIGQDSSRGQAFSLLGATAAS